MSPRNSKTSADPWGHEQERSHFPQLKPRCPVSLMSTKDFLNNYDEIVRDCLNFKNGVLKTIGPPYLKVLLLNEITKIIKVMRHYPSDLTNSQWQVIKNLVDDGRKRKYSMLDVMNATLYITKSGCQWRMLPLHYPPSAYNLYVKL